MIVLHPVPSEVAVVELRSEHTQSEMWGLIFSCELFLVMISFYAMKSDQITLAPECNFFSKGDAY